MTTSHTGNDGLYQLGRATATTALYHSGRDTETPAPSTGKQQKRKEAPTALAAEQVPRHHKGMAPREHQGDRQALPRTIAPLAFKDKWHPDIDPGLVWSDLDKYPLTPTNIAIWLFKGRNSIRESLKKDRVGVQRYTPAQRYKAWLARLSLTGDECPGSLPLPPLLGLRMGYYLPRAMVFWGCIFHWACFGAPGIVRPSWDFPGRADWEAKRDCDTFTCVLAFHGVPADLAGRFPFSRSWPTEAAVLWGNPQRVNINSFGAALEHFSECVDQVGGSSRAEWKRSHGLKPAPSLASDAAPPTSPSEDFSIDEDDSDIPPEELEDMANAVSKWMATGGHRAQMDPYSKSIESADRQQSAGAPSRIPLTEDNPSKLDQLGVKLYLTGRDSPVTDLYQPGSDLPQQDTDLAASPDEALTPLDDTASDIEEMEPTLPPPAATPLDEQGFRWPEDPVLPAPQGNVPAGYILAHSTAACFHCKSEQRPCAFNPDKVPSACVRLTPGPQVNTKRCRLCSYENFSLEQMHCITTLGIAASRTAPLSDGELSSLALQLAGVTLFCGYEGTLSTQERLYLLELQDDTPPAVLQQSAREQANGHWPFVRNVAGPDNGVALPTQLQQSTTAIAGPGTVIDNEHGETSEVSAGTARMLGLLACTHCRAHGHTCELPVDSLAKDRVKCNLCKKHGRQCSFQPSPALKWWDTLARLFYHFSLWVTSEGSRPATPVARAWFDYFKNILSTTPYLITEMPALPTGAGEELKAAYEDWINSSYLQYDWNKGDIDPHIPGVVNCTLFFATAPSTL